MISEQQMKILAFPLTDYDALICDGAIRSGKTSIMIWAFIDWAMKNFNNQKFGICGKTVKSAEENIIYPFTRMTLAKQKYTLKYNSSSRKLFVSCGNVHNEFEAFGGKDEASQNLIQGRTLAGIFLDEVVLMPESFVNQAVARCSVDGSKKWFSCNPASPSHWFYNKWIKEKKRKKALYLHFELTDNPSLSERKIEEYKNQYDGVFYERYIQGRWVAAEGVIYRQYADNPQMFEIKADKLPTFQTVVIGYDYGAGKSKTSMKAVGFTQGFKEVHIISEWDSVEVYEPEMLSKLFHKFYKHVVSIAGKCQYAYADWGGCGSIITKGLHVYCQKNNIPIHIRNCDKGTILERIELTQKLMAEHRLFISEDCKAMKKAFQEAVWSDKHPDERLDDGTSDIDSLDAFEYALYPFANYLVKGSEYKN